MAEYPIYIAGSSDKVTEFNNFFTDAYRTWSVFYAEAYRDLKAYAGDSWTEGEKSLLRRQKRMILSLNKIRRIVNLYSGYERENRTSTVVSPIEPGDQETADQLSETMQFVYSKGQAEYTCSEAFEHMLKTGLSIIGIYIDYSRDKINGDIRFYWKPFSAVILDPYFTKRDLSDCSQAATRDLLSRDEVKALLPNVDPAIIDQIPTGIRDNKFQYYGVYKLYNSSYLAKNILTYDQHWKRITVKEKYLVDVETGESQLVKDDELKQVEAEIEGNEKFKIITSYRKTVELRIIVGGQLLYEGPDPLGLDTFPFVAAIAYHEPLIDSFGKKISGLVRYVVDAQRQYDRRHSQIIDIMESVINTGWIHKNGAVIDPDMLFQSGQGRNVVVNPEFDVNADLKQISPPQIPQGYLAYTGLMDQNIMEIPGGSEEILGLSSTGDAQVSGKLAEVRASNGLKGNRGLFDNFEYTLKLLGGIVLEAIQKNFTPGKVERIIQKNPTPEFFNGHFNEYDCVIKSTVKTQTQREAYYYQLLQLKALGINIPDDEIVAAVPLQGKTNLLKKMQEMQELQKQAAQMEMQDKNRQSRLEESQIEQNIALSQERRARVLADIGLHRERLSEAEQNYAKAMLDNVKTINEIQASDNQQLMQAIELAHMMTQPTTPESEMVLQKDKRFMEGLKVEAEQTLTPEKALNTGETNA